MTDRERKQTRKRFAAAKATLACEGIYLTQEEEELFAGMIAAGLPPEERLERIRAYVARNVLDAPDSAG